jgi:hypothetical protein
MWTEEARTRILKKIDAIAVAKHTDVTVSVLHADFSRICEMPDSNERGIAEIQFENLVEENEQDFGVVKG